MLENFEGGAGRASRALTASRVWGERCRRMGGDGSWGELWLAGPSVLVVDEAAAAVTDALWICRQCHTQS